MNGSVAARIAHFEKLGRRVEQLAKFAETTLANGSRGRFSFVRNTAFAEFLNQQTLHLRVAAIARDVQQTIVDRQADRVRVALNQKRGNCETIFANGKINRFAIVIVAARQIRSRGKEPLDGFEVAIHAGAEKGPN